VRRVRFLCVAALFVTFPAQNQEPVLRITVNLVQVDAVVTDSSGRQVSSLGAPDFEVLEDGRPQKITACTYVKIADPAQPGVSLRPPSHDAVPSEPPAIHIKQVDV